MLWVFSKKKESARFRAPCDPASQLHLYKIKQGKQRLTMCPDVKEPRDLREGCKRLDCESVSLQWSPIGDPVKPGQDLSVSHAVSF